MRSLTLNVDHMMPMFSDYGPESCFPSLKSGRHLGVQTVQVS